MATKAPAKPRITKDKVQRAIVKSKGLLSFASQLLGCNRSTIYDYLEKWPDLKQTVADQREGLVDIAESRLLGNIDKGDKRNGRNSRARGAERMYGSFHDPSP